MIESKLRIHFPALCALSMFLCALVPLSAQAEAQTQVETLQLRLAQISGDVQSTFDIPDSGQTRCYSNTDEIACPEEGDAFFGQDAQYSTNPMSFTDNGDGTITDNVTRLMWEQGINSGKLPLDGAVEYCENSMHAGYDDWRLPNIKELFSIDKFETGWPYADLENFILTSDTPDKSEQYWSNNYYLAGSNALVNRDDIAFGVNFISGHIKAYPAWSAGERAKYAKCVRGDEYGINRLEDNGDGTVSDLASGLMWQQADSNGMDWEDALAYCESADTAGYDDWRLPGIKELQILVDYSGYFPAIDPMFSFAEMINEGGTTDYGYYWSSTTHVGQDEYYAGWYVAFGMAVGKDGLESHGAGAVRYDQKYVGHPDAEEVDASARIHNFVRCTRSETADTALVERPDSGNGIPFVYDLALPTRTFGPSADLPGNSENPLPEEFEIEEPVIPLERIE
ncbi:uncharacterized protein DUF1566 [Yoonia maricola]|uniref:Uncharacterized protein DUF1566 n=2 Tax=Yoonia maricola TaxID=420999 RepID=A0A2M8WM44_9RHOB|nr:uncharacterized protein DUF1566 [Yoonia maricola]